MLAAMLGIGATTILAVVASTWHLSGRITRIETRLDEQEKLGPERRSHAKTTTREAARSVCQGPHDCYYRSGGQQVSGTNPRIPIFPAEGDTIQ